MEGNKVKHSQPETKQSRGRPRRGDNPRRLTVNLPGELRNWLRVHAVKNERDMGDIVSEALTTYRSRARRGGSR